jgi:hypothetical protein
LATTPEYQQSRRQRKKVEMLFAHLKRMLKLVRLGLRDIATVNAKQTPVSSSLDSG